MRFLIKAFFVTAAVSGLITAMLPESAREQMRGDVHSQAAAQPKPAPTPEELARAEAEKVAEAKRRAQENFESQLRITARRAVKQSGLIKFPETFREEQVIAITTPGAEGAAVIFTCKNAFGVPERVGLLWAAEDGSLSRLPDNMLPEKPFSFFGN